MSTITVNRGDLGKALDFASLAVSKRPVAPVMAGMLVTVSAGTVELAAFDYELAARATAAGETDGAGRVLVSGPELAAAVKSLPRGRKVTAELSVYDDGLILMCDGIEATLSAMPLAEYPQLPALPELSGVVDAEAFARSVQRVAQCAGRDDTLPALLCVKVTSEAGHLELAATDRYRLGVDSLHWTGPDGADLLIPASTLARFAAKADKTGKVSLHFGEKFAAMTDGTRTLITSITPGEFPKFRSLIPDAASAPTSVLVAAADLEAAVTRAGKLTERNTPVRLAFTEDGITVQAGYGGEVASTQTVPAALDGEPIEAGFNPDFLASILAGVDGEAMLSLFSPAKPLLVTSGDGFTAVCMPIRIQG